MFNPHIERDLAAVKVAELHRQAAAYRMSRAAVREARARTTVAGRLRAVRSAPAAVASVPDCCV